MRLQFILRPVLLIVFVLSPGLFHLSAQDITVPNPTDTTEVVKPQVIPVEQITMKIEEEMGKLKVMEKLSTPGGDVLKIDSLYPKMSQQIKEQKKISQTLIKSNPNRQKIDYMIYRWKSYKLKLSAWHLTINNYITKLIQTQQTINFDNQTWTLTLENAKAQKIPPILVGKIKETIKEIEKDKKKLAKAVNHYLELESNLINRKEEINIMISDLTNLKNSKVYGLFYQRHPVIWKISFKDKPDQIDKKNFAFEKNFSEIIKYVDNSKNRLYFLSVYLLFIFVLFWILRWAFIKYKFTEQDAALQRAKEVILYNRWYAFILLFLFYIILSFNDAPKLLSDVLVLLILGISIPLVQPNMYKRFKKVVYFVLVLYIIDAIKSYVWFSSGGYRIYLLFETVFVAALFYYFTHPYLKTRLMKIGTFGKILIRITPAMYFLATVSFISNILGYTNLADLSLKIITHSSVVTMIFYAILMVFNGVAVGLIHLHYSIQETYNPHIKFKVEKKILIFIRVFIITWWFVYFLQLIDLWDNFIEWTTLFLSDTHKVGSISFTFGEILMFIVILVASFLLTSLISLLFSGTSGIRFIKLPKGVPAAISFVIRYMIIGFGIILALSALGVDMGKFNLMAGALGLGIGFGLQNVISNFISGLILVFERPILPGDTVEVDNLLGKVESIGVRSSSIRTFDGSEVVVPNNNLISNDLINWTLSDNRRRVEIIVGTSYGSDPNVVLDVLKNAATNNKLVLTDPPPRALFTEFGDSSLNFRLLFWTTYENGLQAKSDVMIAIYNKFAELGIEIPFPQQDVYIKDMPKPTSGEKSHQAPAGIKTEDQSGKKEKNTPAKKNKGEGWLLAEKPDKGNEKADDPDDNVDGDK